MCHVSVVVMHTGLLGVELKERTNLNDVVILSLR